MRDAVRRRGPAVVAGCVLVGMLAAFGPVLSDDTVDTGRSHWIAAGIGALAAACGAWLAWPRLRRVPELEEWGRLVVVAIAASIGALTFAAVATDIAAEDAPAEVTPIERETEPSAGGGGARAPLSDGEGRRWSDLGGIEETIALGIGLVMLVAAAIFFGRQSELRPVPASPTLLRSELALDDPGDAPSDDDLAAALDRTRVALLTDDEPRAAIRRAYRQLLDELEAIGLPRRAYEAPVEYLTRCLGDRELPERPLRALTSVFELARFSDHRLDRADVDLAERCLADATTALTSPSPDRRPRARA